MRPALSNRRGFNESWLIVDVNEAVLRACGIPWDSPEPTPVCMEDEAFAKRFAPPALQSLKEAFPETEDEVAPLILKDPRMCRTLPVWLGAFSETGLRPRVLMPFRHPCEVVRSLCVRDGMAPERACFVWIWHVVESLQGAEDLALEFLFYDRLLADPCQELKQVLGLEVGEEVARFAHPELNHAGDARTAYDGEREPFRTALALYERVSELRRPDSALLDEAKRLRDFAIAQRAYVRQRSRNREKRLVREVSRWHKASPSQVRKFLASVGDETLLHPIERENALLNDKIHRMQDSFSWKLTAPMRWLRRKAWDPLFGKRG